MARRRDRQSDERWQKSRTRSRWLKKSSAQGSFAAAAERTRLQMRAASLPADGLTILVCFRELEANSAHVGTQVKRLDIE